MQNISFPKYRNQYFLMFNRLSAAKTDMAGAAWAYFSFAWRKMLKDLSTASNLFQDFGQLEPKEEGVKKKNKLHPEFRRWWKLRFLKDEAHQELTLQHYHLHQSLVQWPHSEILDFSQLFCALEQMFLKHLLYQSWKEPGQGWEM